MALCPLGDQALGDKLLVWRLDHGQGHVSGHCGASRWNSPCQLDDLAIPLARRCVGLVLSVSSGKRKEAMESPTIGSCPVRRRKSKVKFGAKILKACQSL